MATGMYIPENNAIVGVKYYNDRLYLALPIAKPGAPVTLAWVDQIPNTHSQSNPLLHPFPSWSMNLGQSCDTLQNVQSMEIDRKGKRIVLELSVVPQLTTVLFSTVFFTYISSYFNIL